jgi:hypothetical protein
MLIDNEFMSDEAFLEWLAQKKYVLQHTGIKNQHKLYLDGQLHLVNGLERTTRKRLKIEEKPHPSYYKLHPFWLIDGSAFLSMSIGPSKLARRFMFWRTH